MQSIKDWIRAHPDEGRALMRENLSYIFFKEVTGAGPLGSLNVPITPRGSVAADPNFVPLGAPIYLNMDRREATGLQELAVTARLVLLPALAEGPTVRKLAEVGATLRKAGADVVFVLNKVIPGRTITQDARAYLGAAGELAPATGLAVPGGRNASMRTSVISKPVRGSGAEPRSRRPRIDVW